MCNSGVRLRPARSDDFPRLREIHLASRKPFVELGRTEFLLLPSVSEELLRSSMREGGLVVALDVERPVGFGLCERIDSCSHLEQLSVLPECSGRGIGSAILRELVELSLRRGDVAMTLITYADIAWNGPFYARRGFTELTSGEAPEHLLRLLAEEQARGIDISRRAMMSHVLSEEGRSCE